MKQELLKWVVAFATAVLAAYLGSVFTLRRIKREKRWEAKHEAYRHILSSLGDIHFWAEETYGEIKMLPTVGQEKRRSLLIAYDEAKHKLWTYVRFGELTIGSASREALGHLLSELASAEFNFEEYPVGEQEYSEALGNHAEKVRGLISTGLSTLLIAAKADLN